MALFHRKTWQDEAQERFAHQLSSLGNEVASISKAVKRFGVHAGADAGHMASDLADQAWHQGEIVAKQIGRRAKQVGKAVHDDPLPAIVAVIGFALLLNLVLSRK